MVAEEPMFVLIQFGELRFTSIQKPIPLEVEGKGLGTFTLIV